MSGSFTWNKRLFLTEKCADCGREVQVYPFMGLNADGICIYCRQKRCPPRKRYSITVKKEYIK